MLSRLLEHEFEARNINGAIASIDGPAIKHVMYANYTILFSKATKNDTTAISKFLDRYCQWFG